jgi:hypothetical protein
LIELNIPVLTITTIMQLYRDTHSVLPGIGPGLA